MYNIQDIINTVEYNFLRTDEHLKDNLIFLTFGGSHAYGTSTPTSDIDVRGCAFNRKSDLIGMSSFEQVVEESTDTTVYSFNKLIKLLCECNPNTIEMLGSRSEHYLMYNPVAQEMIDNTKLFLSKKAAISFGGYANQQLRRLQNALARDSYPQEEKEHHISGSVKSAIMFFDERYKKLPEGSLSLTIDKSEQENLETEIFVDVNLKHYPLRDYKNIWSDMHNIVKDYGKLNKRNNKKDDIHPNKHAMHLIRLVKGILLPSKEDSKYKYIKEAVEAYPEIYFAHTVILGEGDSEEIVLPYLIEKTIANADVMGITVAPLGGRHVNYFWKLLNDLEIPHITLLDLDKERYGGGWGRIKYAVKQLQIVGKDSTNLFEKKDNSQMSASDMEKMHEWDINNKKELDLWIKKLEKYDVYFAAPLDMDFLLLESFLEAYKGTIDENYGPQIKGVGKISEIENSGEISPLYGERINVDVRATLKEEGGDGHTYSEKQRALMIWYKYLFLGRGKPSTHLSALPSCKVEKIEDVPQPLRKLITKAAKRR